MKSTTSDIFTAMSSSNQFNMPRGPRIDQSSCEGLGAKPENPLIKVKNMKMAFELSEFVFLCDRNMAHE